MKKIALISIVLLALTTWSAQAQIQFGAKVGLTSTSIKADEAYSDLSAADYDALKVKGVNSSVGFQGGIFTRITILKLYVQPELLFTSTSGEVEVTTLLNEEEQTQVIKEQSFKQIDVPIMVGYKIGPARIQAGPVGTIMLDSEPALTKVEGIEAKEKFNGATWGYQVGAGLDIAKTLTIDVKYEGNLSRLGDGVEFAGQERSFDSRTSQFIVSLGLFF